MTVSAGRPPLPAGGAHPAQGDRRRGVSGRLAAADRTRTVRAVRGQPLHRSRGAAPAARRQPGLVAPARRAPWSSRVRRRIRYAQDVMSINDLLAFASGAKFTIESNAMVTVDERPRRAHRADRRTRSGSPSAGTRGRTAPPHRSARRSTTSTARSRRSAGCCNAIRVRSSRSSRICSGSASSRCTRRSRRSRCHASSPMRSRSRRAAPHSRCSARTRRRTARSHRSRSTPIPRRGTGTR